MSQNDKALDSIPNTAEMEIQSRKGIFRKSKKDNGDLRSQLKQHSKTISREEGGEGRERRKRTAEMAIR